MEQPPFVARADCLQVLVEEVWDVHRLRRGGSLSLHGTQGVGTSRLSQELGSALARRGIAHRLLRGSCSRATPLAYGAFVGVLRDTPGGAEEWLQEASAVAKWNPEHASAALLAGLLRRLASLAADEPVVVVLDDFDAADPSTLQLAAAAAPL
ncbi:MAG: ATP-binding protein, partial [Ilumatobacteraceae bacterium]